MRVCRQALALILTPHPPSSQAKFLHRADIRHTPSSRADSSHPPVVKIRPYLRRVRAPKSFVTDFFAESQSDCDAIVNFSPSPENRLTSDATPAILRL